MITVINDRNGRVFLTDLHVVRGVWERFAGLMLRSSLAEARGLLFRPARGIHTLFMRFPIDLVYLDQERRVRAIRPAMPPWRLDLRCADAVIEVNAGAASAADIRLGDRLRFEGP
jgi:uncharacterized protein